MTDLSPQRSALAAFLEKARARWPGLAEPNLLKYESRLLVTWGEVALLEVMSFQAGFRRTWPVDGSVTVSWSFLFCPGYYTGGFVPGDVGIPDWALEFLYWFVPDRDAADAGRVPSRPLVPPAEAQNADEDAQRIDRMHRQHATMTGTPAEWESAVRLGGRTAFEAVAGLSGPRG